jgi:large subunit ribosomal protein L29
MELTEIRGLPDKELLAKATEIRQRIFQMKFKAQTEPVTNPAEVRDLKKDIARIHTVITERAKKGAPKLSRASREERTGKRASAVLVKATAAKKAAVTASYAASKAKKGAAKKAAPKAQKAPAGKAAAKKA